MALFFLFLLSQLQVEGTETDLLSRRSAISFENADITVAVKTANGVRIAEAFNATIGGFRPQKMRWVSLGLPRLLARINKPNSGANITKQSSFEFAPGGFYAYIETLSESVAVELAKEAQVKYDFNIEPSQFLSMDKHIESFRCFIDLFDSDKNEFVRIMGAAEIIANPVVLFFKLHNTFEKYENSLKDPQRQVIIKCNVQSRGKVRKQNVLTISSSIIDELNLKENLFGASAAEVFITRNQLMELARRIYKSMHIEDKYEIHEELFKTKFVENLLFLTSDYTFEQIDIQTELEKLSYFAIDIKKPDVIYKYLNTFSVNSSNLNEQIALKNDQESNLSTNTGPKLYIDLNKKFSLRKIFGVNAQIEYYNKMKQEQNFKSLSANDQLRTLNTVHESDVRWERKGNEIYPKWLNVTRLYRSKFDRSLTFSRIFKLTEESAFNELISIATDDYKAADIFKESYELARRSIMEEVHRFENLLNNSVRQQLHQSDTLLSNKIACSSSLLNQYLTNTTTLSNKHACTQFVKPSM